MDGRRGHRVVLGAALLSAALAPPASADFDAAAGAHAITSYFAGVQRADGNFADPVHGAGAAPRYSQAMLGAAGLAVARRSGDAGQRQFALRALDYVAARPESNAQRPSVFEIGAAAAAYNALADAPEEPVRQRLAAWLATAPPVVVGEDGAYRGNKSLVEAHALLELCRAGTEVRSDAPRLCARGVRLIEHGLRRTARDYTTRDRWGVPVTVLSDPPGNPIAYHQLTTAYLARAMTLWRESPGTRRLLVRMARGIVALAGPDGDVAYSGRSQEQGWSLVLGAYGLREAARFAGPVEGPRLIGVAARLLERFGVRHAGGPYGTHITPSYAGDPFTRPAGQDSYSNVSTYAGLTAWALSWVADQVEPVAGPVPPAPDFVMPHGTGGFAVVRKGASWFAVRQRRDVADLRSDFGLAAAKARVRGAWRDVVPIKPLTLTGPDSAGPILRVGRRTGYPDGLAIAVRRGFVQVDGGWRTASGRWLRRAVFRFAPAPRGVDVSVRVGRGDRLEYSVFGVAPRAAGRTVLDARRLTRVSLPATARFQAGYGSGDHRQLTRVRLSMRARRAGRLVIRHRAR